MRSSSAGPVRCAVGLLVLTASLAGGIWWQRQGDPGLPRASSGLVGDGRVPASLPPAARAASAAHEADVIGSLAGKPPAARPPDAAAEAQPDPSTGSTVATAKIVYGKLFALRDFFDKGRIEDLTFARFATDPQQVALARRLLADAAYATSLFGGEQAVARVYAVKLLTYMTRSGDDAPILGAIADLRASLNQHGEQVKAQAEDLVQLVQGYTAFRDKDAVARDPAIVLAALGIDFEDVSTEQAKLVARATFAGMALGLRGKMSHDQLEDFLKRAFPQTARGT